MNKKEIFEFFNEVIAYFERLELGILDIVQKYQSGEEGEANNLMAQMIDGLICTIDGLSLTKNFQKGNLEIENMNKFLNEINEALEKMDFILVSDLLEYEILPILKDWKEIIKDSIED